MKRNRLTYWQQGLGALLLLSLSACAMPSKKKNSLDKSQERVDYLSRMVRHKDVQLERLKSENQLLVAQQNKRRTRLDKMVVGKTTKRPKDLYTDAIQAFRKRDIVRLVRAQKLLKKNYPKSQFNDNALFLLGRLNLIQGNYSQSLKYFDFVVKLYPKSSKRVSALFYKGVAYRKLKLTDPAFKLFKEVEKTYPGSPEAKRTKMELRLLQLQTES